MDQVAGYTGATAIMMALYERERSGHGQYIDLSQAEAGMALTGAAFLDHVVNGRHGRRPGFPPGNRSTWPGSPDSQSYRSEPICAPHNCYPCAGNDENAWCAVVARTDDEWQALAAATGDDKLTGTRFATLERRLEHQDEIDQRLSAWTRTLDKYELMERLQAAGVPAGAVQSSADRVERDPQLPRGAFTQNSTTHCSATTGSRRCRSR